MNKLIPVGVIVKDLPSHDQVWFARDNSDKKSAKANNSACTCNHNLGRFVISDFNLSGAKLKV
jgi:hypothetical protein